MKATDLDRIIAARPVDRLAARVTQACGEMWQPDLRPDEDAWRDTPMRIMPFPKSANPAHQLATGRRFGRLVVVGYAGRSKASKSARYVCRCDCGKYGYRRGSSLLRAQQEPMCTQCGYLEDIKAGLTPRPHQARAAAECRRAAEEAARGKPVSVFGEALLKAGANR